MDIYIGNLCTNCGVATSELVGAYSSGADAILTLGWQDYNESTLNYVNVEVNGLLCPDCQTSSDAEGWFLESVATYLRADGWTFPMTTDGGYDDDESMSHHISEITLDDEGSEWWESLSEADEIIVNNYLEQ